MTANELTQLRQEAANLGINLTTQGQQDRIHAVRTHAIDNARQQHTDNRTDAEIWTANVGDGLTIGVITILTVVLLPLVLVGLIVAEWSRVKSGILLFDDSAWRANLIAGVLVIAYVVLLTVREHEQTKHGQAEQIAWSLRTTLSALGYRLGMTQGWQPRRVSSPEQAGQVVGALFWIIVLLGTTGAMADKLAEVQGVWYDGIAAIVTQSSLLDLLTYTGGFLVAFGLLQSSHWAVRYLYEQYLRLRPEVAGEAADLTPAADAAELQYLRGVIAKRKAKTGPKQEPVMLGSNGAGSYPALNR